MFRSRAWKAIMVIHSRNELSLSAIAWMSDLLRDNVEFRQGGLCIPPNSNDAAWPKRLKQPRNERSASMAFSAGMTAVGHRVAPLMWMQRKYIPKKNWLADRAQNIPDNGRGSLRQGRAIGGTGERQRSVQLTMRLKVHFVSQRKARPAAAAIAKVSCNPKRGDAFCLSCIKNMLQIRTADSRRVRNVEFYAPVPIRVEGSIKLQVTQFIEEIVCARDGAVHIESPNGGVSDVVTPLFSPARNSVLGSPKGKCSILPGVRQKYTFSSGRLKRSHNDGITIVVCRPTHGYRYSTNSEGFIRS